MNITTLWDDAVANIKTIEKFIHRMQKTNLTSKAMNSSHNGSKAPVTPAFRYFKIGSYGPTKTVPSGALCQVVNGTSPVPC